MALPSLPTRPQPYSSNPPRTWAPRAAISASFTPAGTNAAENAKLEQAAKDFNAKAGTWTFSISSYRADNLAKARKDLVKAKGEPKKDEAKKAEAKKDGEKK